MADWSELWPGLPADLIRQFDAHRKTFFYKRGEVVYQQDEKPKGIYFVASGLVGLVILAESGKEHLMRFFRTGQFFGHRTVFASDGYHGSAMALEPTEVRLLPVETIRQAVNEHPRILLPFVEVLASELRQCETHQVMILENQILARIARSLIYLKDLHPAHNWTRSEIAHFCASTTSTVIKGLAKIEELGFIKQSGRSIEIVDRGRLLELTDSFHSADILK